MKLGNKLQKYVEKTKNVRINMKSGKSSLPNTAKGYLEKGNQKGSKSSLFNMAKGYLGKS